VRKPEWRSDRDCRTATAPTTAGSGTDNCRLQVCAAVNGDGLTSAETRRSGDRNNSRTHVNSGACCGSACRANTRQNTSLEVRTRINDDRLTCSKVGHIGDFDVCRAGGEAADSVVADCNRKSVQLLSLS
jgi:hypothetical protein